MRANEQTNQQKNITKKDKKQFKSKYNKTLQVKVQHLLDNHSKEIERVTLT